MTDLERAVRRAERERLARKQAETLLEEKSLELYRSNLELQNARNELELRVDQRTKELEIALLSAENSNRTKSEFLANMSHEIRTPMTAILGYADLLLECETQDQASPGSKCDFNRDEIIRTIQNNGQHLLEIINDILDISKIEAGKMDIHQVHCSLSDSVNHVIDLIRVRAQAKNLTLKVEYESVPFDCILVDETRLRQILVNLIGNAIKFTETGEVKLVVRAVASASTSNDMALEFDVIDTGMGMTQQQVDRLFQPFSQADSSMARRFGGTGLGLTISRRLAELLGGYLEVISTEVGKGSRFQFRMPYQFDRMGPPAETTAKRNQPADKPIQLTDGKPLTDLTLLLAEDGLDNQRLISHVLRKAGADVTICENGMLAIQKVQQSQQTGDTFDVILMDMQMPVLDGYSATKQLRNSGYTHPIIALTAHAMSEDRNKCLEAGCDDYTTKPINRTELINLVRQHANIKRSKLSRSHLQAFNKTATNLSAAMISPTHLA